MDDEYDIGRAEFFDVISGRGVTRVWYDIQQAQNEDHIKYDIEGIETDSYFTVEGKLGDLIPIEIVDDLVDMDDLYPIYGFIVPRHLLPVFIPRFPSMEVYPGK